MWGKYKDRDRDEKSRKAYEERKKQTFFDYPEDGYGLADDPVRDELIWMNLNNVCIRINR